MKAKTKNIIDKTFVISIILICLSVYLPPLFKSLSITFLTLLIIISYLSKVYILKFNLNKSNILLLIFYFIHIIGVLYSYDKDEAIFDLEVKLPLIFFPLIFIFIPQKFISKQYFWIGSITIIIGLICNIFYCFGIGIIRSINNSLPLIPEISYTKLSAKLHPSYLSLFASVSLVLTYVIPLKEQFKINNKTNSVIKAILFVIITFFILMLNSKSGIIVMTIAYIWIISNMFFVKKERIISLATLFLIAISYISIFNIEILNVRYSSAIENISEKYATNPNESSMSQRKFIYKNSIKLILEKPMFGQGTGDVRNSLSKLYEASNVQFYSYLNAHNQFIQTTIALGLVGLIILLLLFLSPVINIISQKKYFLLTIFIIIGVSFLFESMLDRNMGSYFFALIYMLSNSYLQDNGKSFLKI